MLTLKEENLKIVANISFIAAKVYITIFSSVRLYNSYKGEFH